MEALSRGIATNSVPSLWMAQMSTRVQVCVCCVTCVPCVCCVTCVPCVCCVTFVPCVLCHMCAVCVLCHMCAVCLVSHVCRVCVMSCVTCVPCVCCVTRVQVCVLRRMCTVCLYVYPLPSLWMAQMSTRVRGRACALLTNEHDVCVNVNHGQRV